MKTTRFDRRLTALAFAIATLSFVGIRTAAAADATVPGDFGTISEAVAQADDTDSNGVIEIAVDAGTYSENVLVLRSNIHLIGAGRDNTILESAGAGHTLRAYRVTNFAMTGFTVRGTDTGNAIYLERCDNSSVTDNLVELGRKGIVLNRTSFSTVSDNLAQNNMKSGIRIDRSDDVIVQNNVTPSNGSQGIDLRGTRNVTVRENVANQNGSVGIRVRGAVDCLVRDNHCEGNLDNGFRLRLVQTSAFVANEGVGNVENGMRMRETTGLQIMDNAFTGNGKYGVRRREWNGDDWDPSLEGIQDAPGRNDLSGNDRGEMRND